MQNKVLAFQLLSKTVSLMYLDKLLALDHSLEKDYKEDPERRMGKTRVSFDE